MHPDTVFRRDADALARHFRGQLMALASVGGPGHSVAHNRHAVPADTVPTWNGRGACP
jgi:hypothetical protein